MRIGLYGGTFDPIHLGHLCAAEAAREGLALDRVVFVPAHVPPHRGGVAPALDRYAMVCLATAGSAAFIPSDAELRRDGPSYTVDTVNALTQAHPDDSFVLIVGSDTYPEMATWRDPEGIFSRCGVAVVGRAGAETFGAPLRPGVLRVSGPGLDVSSTAIRQRLREGKSARFLVPESVLDYIAKRGLYR